MIGPQFESKIDELIDSMTLAEKVGQMTQVEKNSITPQQASEMFIGSILSGGGGYPYPNTIPAWQELVSAYQREALQTRLGIPILYGVDAVHGNNNVKGAVIFPHNIGLGAARDAELVHAIARVTALEVAATGVHWNFAPCVAVPQDIRWGRTYEGFGQDTRLVTELSRAYLEGLQNYNGGTDLADARTVLGSVKHFVGDGGAGWDTTHRFNQIPDEIWGETERTIGIDRGNLVCDEETLRRVHLAPYVEAIQAGAANIMVSFSSWNGLKMHIHHYLLTEVLKGELGFDGFLVSDWMAVDLIMPDFDRAVIMAINAGLDMVMVPFDYMRFIKSLTAAVESGQVPMARIDDAVRRILRVKFACGLFENPYQEMVDPPEIGSAPHRELARKAVQKSLVLLKDDHAVLPLGPDSGTVWVAGQAADDLGLQCGGWSIEWQGSYGQITEGHTLVQALQAGGHDYLYRPDADFSDQAGRARVGLLVLAEPPYAEGVGDRQYLQLPAKDLQLLSRMRDQCERLAVVLYSGRPLLFGEELDSIDALVAAWLPGTEGRGLIDVLFGQVPFSGKLSLDWPRDQTQVPFEALRNSARPPLFTYGHGL